MKGDAGFPVRVRFTKRGKVRFVSHRDVARAFERAFRIEALPLAFTLGFSPRPKVSFGLALGVGHESVAEYLDVELAEPMAIDDLPRTLSDALPEGIDVTGVAALRDRAPSLQEAVGAVEVQLTLADMRTDELTRAVESAIAADTLPVETTRKGRAVVEDLRPAIRRIAVATDDTGHPVVEADTSTSPRGIRPADLLLVLRELAGTPAADGEDRVLRTHQWIERDGARLEPLEADRAALPTRIDDKGLTDDRRDHSGGDRLHPGSAGDTSTPGTSTPVLGAREPSVSERRIA
jgi:radical SAM-linked protein